MQGEGVRVGGCAVKVHTCQSLCRRVCRGEGLCGGG